MSLSSGCRNFPNVYWKLFLYKSKGNYNKLSRDNILDDATALEYLLKFKSSLGNSSFCEILFDDTIMDIICPKPYILINSDCDIFLSTYSSDILFANLLMDDEEYIIGKLKQLSPKSSKFKINDEIVRTIWEYTEIFS